MIIFFREFISPNYMQGIHFVVNFSFTNSKSFWVSTGMELSFVGTILIR